MVVVSTSQTCITGGRPLPASSIVEHCADAPRVPLESSWDHHGEGGGEGGDGGGGGGGEGGVVGGRGGQNALQAKPKGQQGSHSSPPPSRPPP